MPTDHQVSRRERLRAETTREIATIALRQMAADGPGAISLRGIAREMGMTARAIYSYFATRDDLITALIGEMAASLADALEAARDVVPATDPAGRLVAWATALREWALANPEGFRLVYGDSIPGYQAPEDSPVERAALRICGGLNRLVAACADVRAAREDGVGWPRFPEAYRAKIQGEVPGLSPEVAALALRVWGRMHGLVSLEIYGHLRPVYEDPAELYRAEMAELAESLGGSRG
ncbi:TetR/AcrR family transcriptional regulator [Amycolatopsis sp. NPDC059021]|uniref:TetR/AcrR family transcriptional regulator n=1 Tax=Amycolatopsis sp. NPDC059021 TaxID=3346704 RepID=UPI00366B2D80